MKEDFIMYVKTPQEFFNGIQISQNAFLKSTKIIINNRKNSFSQPQQLLNDASNGVSALMSHYGGQFPHAQLSSYSLRMSSDLFGQSACIDILANYMGTGKELNDFTCIAAEIGELLNQKSRMTHQTIDKLKVFDSWVKEFFTYENKNELRDHSAISLLKSRTGVCQAIAALAVKILPYMGIHAIYVTGQGKGMNGWGPHAWNAVYLDHRWVHVDFTFSLNSLWLPSSQTKYGAYMFSKSHRWSQIEYSEKAMSAKYEMFRKNTSGRIRMLYETGSFEFNGVRIASKSITLMEGYQGKKWVNLFYFLRFIGGSCEWIPEQDALYICLQDHRRVVKNVSKKMKNGLFDVCLLKTIGTLKTIDENTLELTLGLRGES